MSRNDKYAPGVVSVSFRSLPPEKIIEAASACSLSCIEWGSDVHCPAGEFSRADKIAALGKAHGVYCSSYGTYFALGRDSLSELPLYADTARRLGTDVLRLWCSVKGSAEHTESEREKLFSECRAAARIAEECGVTLCLERHAGTFTDDDACVISLMENVASPRFRMYWQPFQTKSFDENLSSAAALAPYVENVHVFNWRGNARFPLRLAENEWRAYLSRLSSARALLLEFMPDDSVASLPEESRALFSFIS